MKRLLALSLAMIMLLACLTACAPPNPSGNTNNQQNTNAGDTADEGDSTTVEQVLHLSQNTTVPKIDPSTSTNVNDCIVYTGIFEGLVTKKGNEIIPGMAESWEVNEDNTVFTFHLRDAQWSDGEPVTSKNFYDAIVRLATNPLSAELLWYAEPILNISAVSKGEKDISELGVETPDDKTIIITCSGPTPYFLQLLSSSYFFPCRQDIIDSEGDQYGLNADKLAYNGPFTVTEWLPENKMVLTKNPTYWRADEIKLDSVVFNVVNDTNTAKNLFDNGDLDYLTLGSSTYELYEDYPGYFTYDSGGAEWLQFSTFGATEETGKILANRNFIWALSYAIDRTALDEALFSSNYPYTGIVNPSITAYDDVKWGDFAAENAEIHPKTADVEKAKEYLDKALDELGYDSVEDLPTFTLTVIDGEFYKTVGEYFQDVYSRNLGLKFEVEQLLVPQFYNVLTSGEYDITMPGMSPDWDEPSTFLNQWHSSHPNNATGMDLSKSDKLLDDLRTESDAKKRAEMYKEAERILLTEGPIIPLHMRLAAAVSSERVTGIIAGMLPPYTDYRWAEIVK